MPPTIIRSVVLIAVLAGTLAGCSFTTTPTGGDMSLTVTRDFGRSAVADIASERVQPAPGLARMLKRYPTKDARQSLFVNGILADKPASKLTLHEGDRVWLDQHDGGVGGTIPAVVGAFPEPFIHGVDGKRLPVRVECDDPRSGPCAAVADKLVKLGVIAGRSIISRSAADETLRVLVGTWSNIHGQDLESQSVEEGPATSGVYARFDAAGNRLFVLDTAGRPVKALGAGTGLIAATAEQQRQPVWFVTGTDATGVAAAARAFDESVLTDHFALAITSDDLPVAVPQP
jgi:hypothetical protein